jgi:predicted PurR-regulated permease PerM
MTIRFRTIFFIFLGILLCWFLYIERGILRPFIIAGIFAYLFNPTVSFFSEKIKINRTIATIIIYVLLIAIFVSIGVIITERMTAESNDIRNYTNHLLETANTQISTFPDWIRPTVYDALLNFKKSRFFTTTSLFPLFPKAISGIIGFIIFLFSGFYLLKEGRNGIDWTLKFVPKSYRLDVEIVIRKINAILGGYLRGQLLLVFIMSMFTFIALTIIGVRFSLVVGIFSGFAEIVPVIGPIIAASIAVLVVMLTGSANFGLSPINAAIIVIAVYFVLRHLEDYFIIPQVMGKITKLPPFIIFFAVIAGGHLWGTLGLILAVPIAAVIKILLEYCFDHINERHRKIPGSE